MTEQNPITPPPAHLLKKFSEQAREGSKKRGHPGYCKTFAILCIEWAMNSQSTPNDRQIRSSDITPPPALVQQWMERTEYDEHTWFYEMYIAEQAAQWGADQELEACCEWLCTGYADTAEHLRAARRPKPPSLKEDALAALHGIHDQGPTPEQVVTIRRALEALDD